VINPVPKHIAIIMDGNGRWAKRRFLPRLEGHRAGGKAVRRTVEAARELGVRYLTLYAFSTENWNRPADEVSGLMKLLMEYLQGELPNLIKNKVRLRTIGQKDRFSPEIQQMLKDAEDQTTEGAELDLILALSYGGRQEIVDAINQAIKVGKPVTEESFRSFLYAPDVPDPELLIRTSNEKRISNFLLWQCAYTEFVYSSYLWPDFDKVELVRCIDEYRQRERRFGGSEWAISSHA
jgi:undecaprenyl diphosphate synthase